VPSEESAGQGPDSQIDQTGDIHIYHLPLRIFIGRVYSWLFDAGLKNSEHIINTTVYDIFCKYVRRNNLLGNWVWAWYGGEGRN
jgi:hypothetical protein